MKIAMRRLFYLAVFGFVVWGVVGDWQEVRDFDFHVDFVAVICGAVAVAVLGLILSFRARSKYRRSKMATAPKQSK